MAGYLERLEKGPMWQPEISKHLLLVSLIISKLISFLAAVHHQTGKYLQLGPFENPPAVILRHVSLSSHQQYHTAIFVDFRKARKLLKPIHRKHQNLCIQQAGDRGVWLTVLLQGFQG